MGVKNDKDINQLQECEDFIQTKYGYCFYSIEDEPLIYNLYIHPQYRRQGHSRVLLNFVILAIRKDGYAGKIRIQANPREDSIELNTLIKYYQSMGLYVE